MSSPKRFSRESVDGSVKPFRPRKDPRPEIEKALDRAIEFSQGSRNYTIRDGKFISEDGRNYRYAFTIVEASSWAIPDGTSLPLQSVDFSAPLPIEVARTEEVTVTIIATQLLPEATPASAQLVADRAWFFRKMKDALQYQSTPAQLGLKLFGTLDCPDSEAEAQLVETLSDLFVPDETQHLAIRRALASELLMILGPAGTGKTSVLAFIAMLHALYFNHRVLITSHTNVAIDHAIDRLTTFFRERGLSQWLVVIIDEGSMAPPPAVIIAANRARFHLIVIGDSRQLRPVCKLKDPHVKHWQDVDLVQHWLGRDVFFHGGYTLEDARTGTHHCVMLSYQGRMLSPICDLIRESVYKGYLKDRNPSRGARFKVRPEPKHPVVLCDTSLVEEVHFSRVMARLACFFLGRERSCSGDENT